MAWLRNSYSQFIAKWQFGKSLTQNYPKWELTEVALHLISTHSLCTILLSNQFGWTIAHESLDFEKCDNAVVVTSNWNTDLWTVSGVAVNSKLTWIIWIFCPPILQLIAEVWPPCCRQQHENLFRSILLDLISTKVKATNIFRWRRLRSGEKIPKRNEMGKKTI